MGTDGKPELPLRAAVAVALMASAVAVNACSISDAILQPLNSFQLLCNSPTLLLPACKIMGATGCTSASTGATACCAGRGLTCVIPSGSSSGTCMKPPALVASPIADVTSVTANGVVTTTVRFATAPVLFTNGGGGW